MNLKLPDRHPVRERGLPGGPPEARFEELRGGSKVTSGRGDFRRIELRIFCVGFFGIDKGVDFLHCHVFIRSFFWSISSASLGCLFMSADVQVRNCVIVFSLIPSGDIYLDTGGSQGRRCGKRSYRFP